MPPPAKKIALTSDQKRYCQNILYNAVEAKNIKVVKGILQDSKFISLNSSSRDKEFPLKAAVQNDDYDMCKLLIEYGADCNIISEPSPLVLAVIRNNVGIAELLIKNGANMIEVDEDLNTPLHHAIANGNMTLFKDIFLQENRRSYFPDILFQTNRRFKCPFGMLAKRQDCQDLHFYLMRDLLGFSDLREPGAVNSSNDLIRTARGEVFNQSISTESTNYFNWFRITKLRSEDIEDHIKRNPELVDERDKFGLTLSDHIQRGRLYHRDEFVTISRQEEYRYSYFASVKQSWTEINTESLLQIYRSPDTIKGKGSNKYGSIKAILETVGLGKVPLTDETKDIRRQVELLLSQMVKKMNVMIEKSQLKPGMRLELWLGGSVMEGTKVGLPDEFDVRLYMRGTSFVVHRETRGRNGDILCDLRFEDNPKPIDASELFSKLHCMMYSALDKDEVWLDEGNKDLLLMWKPQGMNTIHLEWMGEEYNGLPIKVDVMFCAEPPEGWWPQRVNNHSNLLPNEHDARSKCCSMVLRHYGWQASACELEQEVMTSLTLEPLVAFIVSKVLVTLFQTSQKPPFLLDSIKYEPHEAPFVQKNGQGLTSYTLKNALFHAMERSKQKNESNNTGQRIINVQHTYSKLEIISGLNENQLLSIANWVNMIVKNVTISPYYFRFGDHSYFTNHNFKDFVSTFVPQS